MTFITVRDLRGKPRQVWNKLKKDRDIIVTSNGKPIAILSDVNEENLEEELLKRKSARALETLKSLQAEAVQNGTSKMTLADINAEIQTARQERRALASGGH